MFFFWGYDSDEPHCEMSSLPDTLQVLLTGFAFMAVNFSSKRFCLFKRLNCRFFTRIPFKVYKWQFYCLSVLFIYQLGSSYIKKCPFWRYQQSTCQKNTMTISCQLIHSNITSKLCLLSPVSCGCKIHCLCHCRGVIPPPHTHSVSVLNMTLNNLMVWLQ